MASEQHLDRDPNDPRNHPMGQVLPTLDEVPEAEPTPVPQFKVKDPTINSIQNIGWDPNDPRARPVNVLPVNPTGEDAD